MWVRTITLSGAKSTGEVERRERYQLGVGGKRDYEENHETREEVFIGWEEEVRELA